MICFLYSESRRAARHPLKVSLARKQAKSVVLPKPSPSATGNFTRRLEAQVHPDAWAYYLKLKVDGHPFDLVGREYQIPIIRDESEWIVMPKGAQMGLTTIFLVRSFHWVVKRKWHGLYLMPLKAGAVPFVQGRIDPIINSNPELAKLFKSVDNRMHKQTIHDIALRIRGTNIWTELREIPSDFLVMDERDKMVEEHIPEAMARLDGSKISRVTELSTPTVPGHGVDDAEAWKASDMHRWFIACPHCSRKQTLTVEENVSMGDKAEECEVFCSHCKKVITDDQRAAANATGQWVPENLNGIKRGYHISQLNSPTKTIHGFMENYYAGLTDTRLMRAWFNNNRGEPFVAYGDQITDTMIDKCRVQGLTLGGIPNGPLYIGVDVGNVLHLRANYQNLKGDSIAWAFRIFKDKPGESMWKQLDEWLSGLGSFTCVIDAHPEKSEAKNLALKYHKRVWIGFEQDRPDQAETVVFNNPAPGEVGRATIARTDAFDSLVSRFLDGRILLPPEARELGEHMPRLAYNGYYYHLQQMVRTEEEDAKGRIVARWLKNKNPDHWHHAEMFAEIATHMAPYMIVPTGVGEIFQRSGGLVAA